MVLKNTCKGFAKSLQKMGSGYILAQPNSGFAENI